MEIILVAEPQDVASKSKYKYKNEWYAFRNSDFIRKIRIYVRLCACVCDFVIVFFSSFVDYLSKFINLVAYVRNTLASVVSTPNNAQLLKIDASSISFGVSWAFLAFHFQFDLFL